jgi:glycosyltransferase involved in cell wall biosynthesis
MHILKIIHGYPPDYNAGSEVYSQSICNELSKKHQVSIFTRAENPYLPHNSIKIEQLNPNLLKYTVNKQIDKDKYNDEGFNILFENTIKEIRPNIAHVGHLNHLSTGIIKLLKKHKIPIVFTLHDYWLMCPRGQFLKRNVYDSEKYDLCSKQVNLDCAKHCYSCYFAGTDAEMQRDLDYWENWVAERMRTTKEIVADVDIFLAPARYLQNRFINEFDVPSEKIQYLDYGFPTHYLQPTEPRKETDIFTFGYIGTHIAAKGINYLIDAFSKIPNPCRLIIWGRDNGQSTKHLKQIAAKSLQPIEFRGEYVNKNLRDEVFNHLNAIVVPSIWVENSPLVIHEAQACQVPVLTADVGGMSEYVNHLENGLLFSHRSVDSLLQQLIFAVENPLLLANLGKRGYLYDKNGSVPTINKHCELLEQIYKKLL